jgi:pimeloyl-ACP methyl ester carboxylesterase
VQSVITSHEFRHDDLRLHYVAGGAGTPVVFLHGVSGDHQSFLPFLEELGQGWRGVALDFRGHGRSGRAGGRYRVPDFAADVVALIESELGGPAVLAGHSLGALVATWLTARRPDLVRGALLEDPPLYAAVPPRFATTIFAPMFTLLRDFCRAHHARAGGVEALAADMAAWPAGPESPQQTFGEFLGPALMRIRAEQCHHMDPEVLTAFIAGAPGYEPDALLAAIRRPVHFLSGEETRGAALSDADVAAILQAVAGATHTRFAATGHLLHMMMPQRYLAELQALLSRVAATSAPSR